jgi:hypothetical protein
MNYKEAVLKGPQYKGDLQNEWNYAELSKNELIYAQKW